MQISLKKYKILIYHLIQGRLAHRIILNMKFRFIQLYRFKNMRQFEFVDWNLILEKNSKF